ncbi:MAG: RagB/SusD family nutrient uptake outer membrane protein [Flavobacterium sp.]|nr:RagB/SusD family nutrient uptake outer membrane protein [Candidatus Neoflavobacterium equi]
MKISIKNILGTCLMGVVLTSCSDDDVLNLVSINSINEETAFSTPSLIQASVNGMYEGGQIGNYVGAPRGYVWGAAFIQQNDMRGEDGVNVAAFYQITYQADYDATTGNNVFYWDSSYKLINRANLVIEGVQRAVADNIIDAQTGNNYIGQAYFLRAITHFELLIHFSRPYQDNPTVYYGVPYRAEAINSIATINAALSDDRSNVAETYTKILADLDLAEQLITTTEVYRATRNAAVAFKAKVKLHQRDWFGVLEEVSKIENLYQLTATPSGVFDNNSGNTESIFSIQHSGVNNPGVNGAIASQYKGRTLVAISPIIWNDSDWLADDLRRNQTFQSDNSDDFGNLVYDNGGVKYSNKYRDVNTFTDYTPIVRHAEILLMKAEAEARINGVTSVALDALNAVRNRALRDPNTQAYTLSEFGSPAQLVEKIIKERRIEFLLEGKRWTDIHRLQQDNLVPITGIPAKYTNGTPQSAHYTAGIPYTGQLGIPQIPYENFRFLWPIPIIEINVYPNLANQQNPGY